MSATALLFVIGYLAGCVMAFARHPIFGLATYVLTLFIHPPSRWWGQGILLSVRWSLFAAAVTLIAIIVSKERRKHVLSLQSHGAFVGLMIFNVYLIVQSLWALDQTAHAEMISYYIKFALGMVLIYLSVDSEKHLKIFLWAHVLGCAYFGWIAFTTYEGGRFEGFGGPGLGEANAGALTIVTGIYCAAAIFLMSDWRTRGGLFLVIPLLVNALVTTISRSGFLSMGAGGIVYNIFTPPKYRRQVRFLSVLAAILFIGMTNPTYWMRIASITHAGEEVEGVDTGSGRLVIISSQFKMFAAHPLGCGHACTEFLSPSYMDESMLDGVEGGGKARASHNTFMTMLVDHGIVGAAAYILLGLWILKNLWKLAKHYKKREGVLPTVFPSIAGILGAMTVGDLFVSYIYFEVRIWFLTIMMVMLSLAAREVQEEALLPAAEPSAPAKPKRWVKKPRYPVRPRAKPGAAATPAVPRREGD